MDAEDQEIVQRLDEVSGGAGSSVVDYCPFCRKMTAGDLSGTRVRCRVCGRDHTAYKQA